MKSKFARLNQVSQCHSKVKVIWNLTKICAWDCEFCCIDAYHVCKKDNSVLVRTKCLTQEHRLIYSKGMDIFEAAKEHLIKNKMELSLSQKLKVLENINLNAEIDFSGGDPLLNRDNHIIIKKASEKFGKENIHITATGIGFSRLEPKELAKIAGCVDFTYDSPELKGDTFRPDNYNYSNLMRIARLKQAGLDVMAQIPLTNENIFPEVIEKIYLNLHEQGVDSILLMKFISVGRGAVSIIVPPDEENLRLAVDQFKSLEAKYKQPTVKLQTALRESFEKATDTSNNFASSHLSITPMGLLSSSPWAFDKFGEPLDEFVIGNLIHSKISRLMETMDRKNARYTSLVRAISNKAASILY